MIVWLLNRVGIFPTQLELRWEGMAPYFFNQVGMLIVSQPTPAYVWHSLSSRIYDPLEVRSLTDLNILEKRIE